MKIVLDRIQAEEAIETWKKKWGDGYVATRVVKFIEFLELDSFETILSPERIDLKVEMVNNNGAALYWRSSPRGQTDRMLVFCDLRIVLGLEQYFWATYYRALAGRSLNSAVAEVRAWAESQLY